MRLIPHAFCMIALFASSQAPAMSLVSRANCGNNESITWDWTQQTYPEIGASSHHVWNGVEPDNHTIFDVRMGDNAAKAIDWGEGMGSPGGPFWTVSGLHRWTDEFGVTFYGDSFAIGCNL